MKRHSLKVLFFIIVNWWKYYNIKNFTMLFTVFYSPTPLNVQKTKQKLQKQKIIKLNRIFLLKILKKEEYNRCQIKSK